MTATKLISKKRDLSPIFLATIRSAVERIVAAVKPSKVILLVPTRAVMLMRVPTSIPWWRRETLWTKARKCSSSIVA